MSQKETNSKQWYQKPFGVLVAILFWFLFIPWFIWTKTDFSQVKKVSLTMLVALIVDNIINDGILNLLNGVSFAFLVAFTARNLFFDNNGILNLLNGARQDSAGYVSSINETLFSNERRFIYDRRSDMTIDSFNGLSTKTDLLDKFSITAIRENEGEFYTVYSLKARELAYVIFYHRSDTGEDFHIADIVEYPFSSPEEEQKLWFLLSQDQPEMILSR